MVSNRLVNRIVLAASLALPLSGLAAVETAQAMPVVPLAAQAAPAAVDVYYRPYRYRRYNRHRHAGLYNCGPGGLNTHLARQACGYGSLGHNGRYR